MNPHWGKVDLEVACRHCGKRWRVGTPWKPCPNCESGHVKVLRTDGDVRFMRCEDCGERFKVVEEAGVD